MINTFDNRDDFKKYVEDIAELCIGILIDAKELKRPASFKKKFTANVRKCDRSWGGYNTRRGAFIVISIKNMHPASEHYKEYKRIKDHPVIGEFNSNDTLHHIQGKVAHEMAHAVDVWNNGGTDHGADWRYLYRLLRTAFGLTKEVLNNE